MGRKRNVLQSTERHNSRNYKRRLRNLFIEIIFILVLTFVAIKFVNKDNQMPKVSGLTEEEQKQIINNEMKANEQDAKVQTVEKEIKLPENNMHEIKITKAIIKYDAKSNQTILKLDVKNYSDKTSSLTFRIALIDYTEKTLTETYINVEHLNGNAETRINTVLNDDLRNTEKIEILDEK